jgi:hypothetical protein
MMTTTTPAMINILSGSKRKLECIGTEPQFESSTPTAQTDSSKGTLPRERVVRFQLNAEQVFKELRQESYGKHGIRTNLRPKKLQKVQRNGHSHPTWLTSKELRHLQFQCLQSIMSLERQYRSTASSSVVQSVMDDVGEFLILRRYFSSRRRLKRSVQKQLHNAVQVIQDIEVNTGIPCPDLLAEACQNITKSMIDMAHWEGVCFHVNLQQGTNSASPQSCAVE